RSVLGWSTVEIEAPLLDEAERLYMEGGLIAAECKAFLETELPTWIDALDPRGAARLRDARPLSSPEVQRDARERVRLARAAPALFADADVLVWPTHTLSPPPVADLADLDAYLRVNRALLAPTCPVSALDLCAVTIPVGRDGLDLPVGLQLVAPGGADARLLAVAARLEGALRGR
ncbi:MAG: amidase, partial [Gemmatimonadetes bacterium]|nr:amidase [Gemmatimonadota bacterium]